MPKLIARSSTPSSKEIKSVNPGDELIADMIRKRKLQQEALLKIMTSIEDTIDEKKSARAFKTQKKASPAKNATSNNTVK